MMVSRGLFGWSPPRQQPLTPVSEVSECPSPYVDTSNDAVPTEIDDVVEETEEIEQPPETVPFSRLFACADRFDWVLMVVGSVAAAAHGTALVVYLHYFAKIIQLLSHGDESSDLLFHRFKELALTLLYIAGGVFAAGWIEVSCWILTGERQTAVIRSRYVQVLLNQDMSFFDTYGNNGDIVSQVLSDVLLIQSALSEKVGNYIHNMATFFSGLAIGFLNCWQIAGLTLLTGPFIVAAGGISNIFLHRLAENIQDAYAEAASVAEQAFSYMRTLYAFTNETLAKYSYAASLQATLRYGILISLVQGLGLGFTYGLAICSCALQLYVGRFLVIHKYAHGGEIVTALFAVILSGLGLNQAATNFYSFEQGRIAAYRLFEMIARSSSSVDNEGNILDSVQGNIEFRNVYFSYLSRPEIPILSGFYLTVPAKKTVALVGRNGSGKSSIIPLMERFYDPTLGEVLLDGENIKNLKLEWLRSQIGLVTQEPALLSLTHLKKGYDTQVGRAGLSLTEEQKIRLSVARAVLSNPCILLLDEVTAVMEEGQLMEIGTHDELIASDGLYAELLRCEEAAKLPKRMPARTPNETSTFQIEKDSTLQEPSSPKFTKSPSLQRASNLHTARSPDSNYNSHGSPKKTVENGTENQPPIKRQDSFEKRLPNLPKIDVHSIPRQQSLNSDPESPISPLLTSDPDNERSHSQTFSRLNSRSDHHPVKVKVKVKVKSVKEKKERKDPPSMWRLVELSFAEWLYAVLGSIGAAIFGAFNPLLAYVIALVVTEYYKNDTHRHMRHEVDKWCLIIACMGVVTVVANFLQHFYFGIMGEKMTERVRRMMFSAMLRNEIGWFDEEENSADTLSMRLANDATFVRAAFSNRLSIFIQDVTAVLVALLIGMLLEWRLALVALATVPVLTVSAIAQKLWLAGFSKGIQEMHRKASLVLEDSVRNIYTVVSFCAGNKVMELYRFQLHKIFTKSFLHGLTIGFAFGFSQFLLFACNAFLLYYTALSIKNHHVNLPTAIKSYIVFSFSTFALVEPFGLAPYILKRRKSLTSVFEIIDRIPKIDPDDPTALKPPNVYGSIELKTIDFSYPTRPDILVLNNFSLKITGGTTVAVVGVSGSGKSTIISLIERFYDPVSGSITLDGRDLKQFNLRWLRNHLGVIQQEPAIFLTTIKENIIYARHNASEAEIKEAARIANAHHFISNLPHGYDTHVGMRGVELTPGQKQRIAIARVVLKNAPILLLDEASSAIESESSRVVQEALDTLVMGNKTTILIAHRAAMMRHVDNIVVINGGRIVEEGGHDSLMEKNGLYVRLMQPHFGKGVRQHRLL
ncbi:unnamed protein product [Lactuca virosa]|uniref:ABC transporter B family member 20 n=1 Tax=Lactuca virosa TaxID=75947 RepID=A0AAU9NBC8_9ASTR|nr:unnamed protein product [Lactuca virosa]